MPVPHDKRTAPAALQAPSILATRHLCRAPAACLARLTRISARLHAPFVLQERSTTPRARTRRRRARRVSAATSPRSPDRRRVKRALQGLRHQRTRRHALAVYPERTRRWLHRPRARCVPRERSTQTRPRRARRAASRAQLERSARSTDRQRARRALLASTPAPPVSSAVSGARLGPICPAAVERRSRTARHVQWGCSLQALGRLRARRAP